MFNLSTYLSKNKFDTKLAGVHLDTATRSVDAFIRPASFVVSRRADVGSRAPDGSLLVAVSRCTQLAVQCCMERRQHRRNSNGGRLKQFCLTRSGPSPTVR